MVSSSACPENKFFEYSLMPGNSRLLNVRNTKMHKIVHKEFTISHRKVGLHANSKLPVISTLQFLKHFLLSSSTWYSSFLVFLLLTSCFFTFSFPVSFSVLPLNFAVSHSSVLCPFLYPNYLIHPVTLKSHLHADSCISNPALLVPCIFNSYNQLSNWNLHMNTQWAFQI